MLSTCLCIRLLCSFYPTISLALTTNHGILGRVTQTASISAATLSMSAETASIRADFEDASLNQGTIFTDLYGLHFDGFASLVEAPVGQLILYNGSKAAIPAPSGNEVRTDLSTTKYKSFDPQSVSVGCFLNKRLGALLSSVPLSSVGLEDLATALKGFAGAASTASKCTIRVRVLGMTDARKWNKLKQDGHGFVDCPFTPTLNVAGQGMGQVQPCDLSNLGWSGVTRLKFMIQSVGTVSTGSGTEIGNTAPAIDDLIATGQLK